MLVPYYGFKKDNTKTYENNDYIWVDLSIFLNVLSPDVIKNFDENPLEDDNWIEEIQKIAKSMKFPPVSLKWDNFVDFSDFMISAKLLYMTGFSCKYWLWKHNTGNHHWIDLILPKDTPIESFTEGIVYDILKDDKYWWNCVIIKTNDLFFCYSHLEKVNVKKQDKVNKWQIIWTCGSTGNSTTYHLHFQIDKSSASFHPYRWKNESLEEMEKYCIDWWEWLRKNYVANNKSSVKTTLNKDSKSNQDISKKTNENYEKNKTKLVSAKKNDWNDLLSEFMSSLGKQIKKDNLDYVKIFENAHIIKWDEWKLYLNNPLTRYQLTLILYRLKQSGLLNLSDANCKISFKDIWKIDDNEFKQALKFVVCNNILHWDKWYFYPYSFLTWIQFLAVIWRLFWKLSDYPWKKWYKNYLQWAISKRLIWKQWKYLFKPVPRKEVINILWKLIYSDVV